MNLWIPCANDGAGEWVSGPVVLLYSKHFNKDGDLTKLHMHPQQSSMIGQITGMAYQSAGATQVMLDSKPLGNGSTTYTFIERFHAVGKGVQYYVKNTVHYTINANGVLTANVSNSSIECK